MPLMTILAIETSCDETAAAVIRNGRIVSNVVASQAALHSRYGGVVPEVAAREHLPTMIPVIELALKNAKLGLNSIDTVAVTKGPGLATSLSVGIDTAKALGTALGIPVLPVNHMEAHIYANFIDPKAAAQTAKIFPALVLVVSGGHTVLVLMRGHGQYQIVGETVDDAAGEAFDKSAKLLGLGYPGGPQISRLAELGDPEAFNFPRPMIKSQNLNFSYSGLKTAVMYAVEDWKIMNGKISAQVKRDLAASVQRAILDTLVAKTEMAIAKYRPKTIMLGGGVAANRLLRQEFSALAKKRQLKVGIPLPEHCTDNAAMIGLAAHYRIKHKRAKFQNNFRAEPNLSLK